MYTSSASVSMRRRGGAEVQRDGTSSVTAVSAASAIALALGWASRHELYLVPDRGLGYGLGIAGLAMMVLLMTYSLRKRMRFMRSWGRIRYWFQPHMVLGILGPVAILFHANFRRGSLNSTVALVCMLLVAGSGIVGRFIYTKIHLRLSGHRTSLGELRSRAQSSRSDIDATVSQLPEVARGLQEFESFALAPARGLAHRAWRLLVLGHRLRRTHRASLRALEREKETPTRALRSDQPPVDPRSAARDIWIYLNAVRRTAEFTAYERLFSLWHALHLPLCLLLFGSATVHVIAVHMY